MTKRKAFQTKPVRSEILVQSAVIGAGGAATANAAGLLAIGKGVAAGALAMSPLGATIAIGALVALLYGSNAVRPPVAVKAA
ncbi:MAG TPA: hypothetical protein HPQ04_03155 [Rhodospirillaceae bacterium]|nr:hypothetical protein [Rhodospirillaceae bacterium]